MSKKFRPTFVCSCGGTLTTGCWVAGNRSVKVGEGGGLARLENKGYWELSCDKCDYKGSYTP